MRGNCTLLLIACVVLPLVACRTRQRDVPFEEQLQAVALALREGRLEGAAELLAAARARHGNQAAVATWSSVLAEISWRDDDAVREMQAAVRAAVAAGASAAEVAELRGRLGDLLFQAGRWGEAWTALTVAGVAVSPQRAAFATVAAELPSVRQPRGPLLTEQPLLPGDTPEFVCGAGGRQRPFAIDTGTSMTTLGRSFAEELAVAHRVAAGEALDSGGRKLPIEVGVLPQFEIGDVDMGATPVLVVDDAALRLRDLFGGAERVPRGVLGLDLLAAMRLSIDPERASVTLELPRGLPADQSVQCVRVDGRCLAPVTIEGVRFWFVLDTGASHSSLSDTGLARLPDGDARVVPTYRRVRTVGGGTVAVREVRGLVLRCSEARFAGLTLPVVPRGQGGMFPVHGVLGIDLLGRCRLTLDRGRARLVAPS
jgi:hypothetical protein